MQMQNNDETIRLAAVGKGDALAPITDAEVEQQLQAKGLNAPRLTPQTIQMVIVEETYTRLEGTNVTVCLLTLANGYTVLGKNMGPVSAANFDQEMGCQLAYKNAVDQVWQLEGYLLRERLFLQENGQTANPNANWLKMDSIARVCHEVNRAYCLALGDTSQPAWEDAPEWQRSSARMGVDLHLLGDFGPEASHVSWMNQKAAEGWVYGPVKDPEAKTHPCMVPFDQLPREQQAKDFIFRAVVHALKSMQTEGPGVPEGFTHVANPVPVKARQITGVEDLGDQAATEAVRLRFADGSDYVCDPTMTARYWPLVGDYLVEQQDGYTYLNPRAVFEAKYRKEG